jgi:hypothetical protein
MKGCDEMKREPSGEIIHPKDFYHVLAKFKVPIGKQDWWLIRWGMIASISLLSVLCFYVAMVSRIINLHQLLLASFAVPLWMGVYFFFPITIATVFNQLWNAGAIGNYRGDSSKSMTYQDFVTKRFLLIHSPWLNITSFLILVLVWCFQWRVHGAPPIWDFPWIQLVISCLYTFIAYVAFLSVMRFMLVAVSINRLFLSFTINVFPLHPDGSAGLGALHHLLWISTIMLIAGLCFITSLGSRAHDSVFFIVILSGYLIVFPAIMTVWLALPHRKMIQARNVHLETIIDEYNKTLQGTSASITEPTAAIAEGTERLETLQKRYEQVKGSFPAWPVQISFASRLGLTLLLPLLTSFVPAVINLLTKIIK